MGKEKDLLWDVHVEFRKRMREELEAYGKCFRGGFNDRVAKIAAKNVSDSLNRDFAPHNIRFGAIVEPVWEGMTFSSKLCWHLVRLFTNENIRSLWREEYEKEMFKNKRMRRVQSRAVSGYPEWLVENPKMEHSVLLKIGVLNSYKEEVCQE